MKAHKVGASVCAVVLAVSAIAVALAGPALATGGPPGNNGTIKIHEQGTPSGTESNDPKVCVFNVEGYGFDVGQSGYLMFTVQGGDAPTGTNSGPHNFGPTTASEEHRSFYATEYFTLDPGHYKATLYGKDTGGNIVLTDEKAGTCRRVIWPSAARRRKAPGLCSVTHWLWGLPLCGRLFHHCPLSPGTPCLPRMLH